MKYFQPQERVPPFKINLVLILPDNSWREGFLESLIETKEGKEFKFTDRLAKEVDNVVYWAIPQPPKKK